MSGPLLEMRDLRCHFPSGKGLLAAVDGVSLDIQRGEVLGLVGESGSGKSTLGRIITGLQSRSAGSLCIDGRSMPRRFGRRDFRFTASRVQMVFQDSYASLNPRLSIIESLREPLRSRNMPRQQALALAREWLDRVGLASGAAERYPHELSGGQRQRVGIARAFIAEPSLVICDEPVSALDVSVQAQIINLLQTLQREQHTAMLFIAHDLAVVRHLAQRTAVMYLGEVVELGDSAQVFSQPQHPYSRALLASHLSAEIPARGRRKVAAPPLSGSRQPPLASDEGCRFANRCPHVAPLCRQSPPWLQPTAVGEAACHRLDSIATAPATVSVDSENKSR